MDPRNNTKIPRSSTPSPSKGVIAGPRKKKAKKKDKNKKLRVESTANNETGANQEKHRHHKDTATADGHMMAQMLSTFTNLEQSRFQAYKRSCFSADAIEAWVAACLEYKYSGRVSDPPRPLKDLVAPGQAAEIGLVVAVAAKVYAQRLVAEAVAIQEQQQQQQRRQQEQQQTVGDGSENPSGNATVTTTTQERNNPSDSSGTFLQCTSVWKAVQERKRRGVDPGFFLQPAHDRFNWAAGAATAHHNDIRRLAVMAAQDEYDERQAKKHAAAGTTSPRENDMDVVDETVATNHHLSAPDPPDSTQSTETFFQNDETQSDYRYTARPTTAQENYTANKVEDSAA